MDVDKNKRVIWTLSLLNFNHSYPQTMKSSVHFLHKWYPVILAFACLFYSVGLGILGHTEEALYSAHWAGTILLFSIAIRQRRITQS